MNKYVPHLFVGVLALSLLVSCTAPDTGESGDIKTSDDISERKHLKTELTMADYKALAEEVTNQFLASDVTKDWSKRDKKPRLVVGNLRNNTNNEDIRMPDIHDRITTTLIQSDLVRILDRSANEFDYIIRSELTSTTQSAGDRELDEYTFQMNVYKLDGELIGQWSDDMRLSK